MDDFKKLIQDNLETVAKLPKLKKGDLIQGKVVDVKKGTVLVDIGAKSEGVISGKELATKEKLEINVGDGIMVYVVNPEDEVGNIVLSLRRTDAVRRWLALELAQKSDEVVVATVTEANTGGVLVMVGGLSGFIPTSQLSQEVMAQTGISNMSKDDISAIPMKLNELVGKEIKAKIMELDRKKNRIILSEKLVVNAQSVKEREATLKRIKVGDALTGQVTGITPFGLFVNAEGLEGLVHLSEMSWDKVDNPADLYEVGKSIKVQLIGLSDNGKRVAYSIKRLTPDPWATVVSKYKVGQLVSGKITKIAVFGAFVRIDDGLNGLIHISELSDKMVTNPEDVVKVGDAVEVMIISISPNERHLGLSLKRVNGKEVESLDEEMIK
ncbi:MAG: S1 RNA-binding domain-containing protein [bacterium]